MPIALNNQKGWYAIKSTNQISVAWKKKKKKKKKTLIQISSLFLRKWKFSSFIDIKCKRKEKTIIEGEIKICLLHVLTNTTKKHQVFVSHCLLSVNYWIKKIITNVLQFKLCYKLKCIIAILKIYFWIYIQSVPKYFCCF